MWSITSLPHIWKPSPACLNKAAGGRLMYPGSAALSITARRRTFPGEVLSWPQQQLWLHSIWLVEVCPWPGHPSLHVAHQAGLDQGWDTWIIPGARPPMVMSFSLPLPSFLMNSESRSVVSNSLWPHGLYSPWTSPGQDTGVGRLCLLPGIFPTQGSNPGLLHCRQARYPLSHQGSVSGIDILVLFLMLVGRLFSLLPLSVKLAASFLDALYQVNWGSSCLFLVCWLFLFWKSVGFFFFFGQMLFLTYTASKMTHFFVFLFSICRNWLAHQMCGGCGRKQGYSQSCKYQPFQRRCPVS